jgi:hypothetical protein
MLDFAVIGFGSFVALVAGALFSCSRPTAIRDFARQHRASAAIWVPGMFDMSGDELGWLLAISFTLVFGATAGAIAYFLSRTG